MSPAVAIISTIVLVTAIWTAVVTVLRYLVKRADAETAAQKRADERYRAAKKSG